MIGSAWRRFADTAPPAGEQVLAWRPESDAGFSIGILEPEGFVVGCAASMRLKAPDTDAWWWCPLPSPPAPEMEDIPAVQESGVTDAHGRSVMPPVMLRYRCGSNAIATDDAPFGAAILPGPRPGTALVTLSGTAEQAWLMFRSLAGYLRQYGIMDMAKQGMFVNSGMGGIGQVYSEREFDRGSDG